MMFLEITYADGSHDAAWGGIEMLEQAIERAGQRVFELQAHIVEWSIRNDP